MDKAVQWCVLVDRLYLVAERSPLPIYHTDIPDAWLCLFEQVAGYLGVAGVMLECNKGLVLESKAVFCERKQAVRIGTKFNDPYVHLEVVVTNPWDQPFTSIQNQQIDQFARQLFLCLDIHNRIIQTQMDVDALIKSVDQLPLATILANPNSQPLFVNQACKELLARNPKLLIEAGGIGFRSTGGDTLKCLLAKGQLDYRPYQSEYRQFVIESLLFSVTRDNSGLILFIEELANPACPEDISNLQTGLAQCLQENYGLSKKEIQLACGLALGLNLKQYSELCHRSLLTVRSQLKSILQKTATSDQRSLNLLILSLRNRSLFKATLCSRDGQDGLPRWIYPPRRMEYRESDSL